MSRLFAGPEAATRSGWERLIPGKGPVVLVSEPRVLRIYGEEVRRALRRARRPFFVHAVAPGEAAKAWSSVERLLGAMLERGLGRDGALAALGGGSVTDTAGFAASIYLRGIPWVSLPTTLLGQLDSGLGGKTGINLAGGKNLAGSFHEPAVVVCDTGWLATLSARERLSGLAEALKYGLVFDPALWRLMLGGWEKLMDGDKALTGLVVRRGAAWKLKAVALDPRETFGPRELLNFGHTLGHGLEAAAGLGRLRHGEAVIWGMRAALKLSAAAAGLSIKEADAAEAFLETLAVPIPRSVTARAVLAAAKHDKKARGGKLRFVLLKRLGRAIVTDRVPAGAVSRVVEELL